MARWEALAGLVGVTVVVAWAMARVARVVGREEGLTAMAAEVVLALAMEGEARAEARVEFADPATWVAVAQAAATALGGAERAEGVATEAMVGQPAVRVERMAVGVERGSGAAMVGVAKVEAKVVVVKDVEESEAVVVEPLVEARAEARLEEVAWAVGASEVVEKAGGVAAAVVTAMEGRATAVEKGEAVALAARYLEWRAGRWEVAVMVMAAWVVAAKEGAEAVVKVVAARATEAAEG